MKHVADLIQAYVAKELDPDRTAAVREHLAGCAACRAEADRTRDLWELLGTMEIPLSVTPSVWPSVRERTLGRQSGSRGWFFGNGPWMRTGLATAALAAGLIVGVLAPTEFQEPSSLDGAENDTSWLLEASWLSGSSWLAGEGSAGLDEILLGAELPGDGNGS